MLEEIIPLDLDANMAKPASTDARHTRLLRRLDYSLEGPLPMAEPGTGLPDGFQQ
jgi:hypothetical protein